MSTTTKAIADFGSSTGIEDLSDEVRESAIRALDHVLSSAVSMRNEPIITSIIDTLTAMQPVSDGDDGGALVALSPFSAALAIGVSASLALDKSASTFERLACVIVPPSFVAARNIDCPGATLVSAVAIGSEIGLRTAAALGAQHVSRGWDLVGSAGRIGATVAVSKVLGLSASKIHNALGFASTMSAGILMGGETLSALSAGKAAADALEAATLGMNGLIGPPAPLEGRRGLFALVSPGSDPSRLVEGLGQHWEHHLLLAPFAFADAVDQLADDRDVSLMVHRFSELTASLETT